MKTGDYTHDPVVRLFVPNDLAAVVTEIIGESLAAFGYRTAYTTNPSLRYAKVSPRLILLAFVVVGAHDVREFSSAFLVCGRCAVRLPCLPFCPVRSARHFPVQTEESAIVVNRRFGKQFLALPWLDR
jgi:hypothetical protein